MPADPNRPRACPLCGKPRDPDYKPFCSRACRDRDLLNWFGEGYRVASDEPGGAPERDPDRD